MKVNTKLAEAKWVKYPDDPEVEFKLRPFPMSQGFFMTGGEEDIVDYTWKRFNYCVVGWKGILDEKGKTLTCKEKNKKFIFDYVQEIMMWVALQIRDLTIDITTQKKT